MDITPSCDAAHGKGGIKRVVYGYLIRFNLLPSEDWGGYEYSKSIEDKVPDATYVTPEFYDSEGLFVLALSSRYVSFVKTFDADKYLFRLNSDLLCAIRKDCVDALSKIGIRAYSSNVMTNRPAT